MKIVPVNSKSERLTAVEAHPLAELLNCPPGVAKLLTGGAQSVNCAAGERIFGQGESARGLYLVLAGQFLRKAERFNTRLTMGIARSGDLLELAAALGDRLHTYSLAALTPGTLLLLPMDALQQAFDCFPPLRMRLLEELAREVSRAYLSCSLSRVTPIRRRANTAAQA